LVLIEAASSGLVTKSLFVSLDEPSAVLDLLLQLDHLERTPHA
jgi:hypothetical protein